MLVLGITRKIPRNSSNNYWIDFSLPGDKELTQMNLLAKDIVCISNFAIALMFILPLG